MALPLRRKALPTVNRTFVDREEPQRLFERWAFAIPAGTAVVRVFHGPGGQGKTALRRELMRKTDRTVEPSYGFLRRAELDLAERVKTDPDLLLVWIRNAFAQAGVGLPCFDLALALMWEGTRGEQPVPILVNPWLARTREAAGEWVGGAGLERAGEAIEAFAGAGDSIGEIIKDIPALGPVLKGLGGWVVDRAKRAWLEHSRKHLQDLYRDGVLLPAHELSRLLPWMLAQDLNFHLANHPDERFVLFVDEYERVFDQAGAGARWIENPFDRHMREFITEANGLLVVFFMREPLPWGSDPEWSSALEDAHFSLPGLEEVDGETFLSAIPIPDPAVRRAMIEGARETSAPGAPVYPLMLSLQVEHWRHLEARKDVRPDQFAVTADSFETRCGEMVARVLRDYDLPLQVTLERLSVARRFDRAAFGCIVETFRTGLPLDSFDQVAGLSFVTRGQDGFVAFHGVIASAIRELLDEERRQYSLAALFTHFEARARVATHFELTDEKIAALFEASWLRQQMGAEGYVEWLAAMGEPLEAGARYVAAAALWREALDYCEATYGQKHLTAISCLSNLCYFLMKLGDFEEAMSRYQIIMELYNPNIDENNIAITTNINNISGLLREMGLYQRAFHFLIYALHINKGIIKSQRFNNITIINNIALLMMDIGEHRSALPLFELAHEACKAVYGPDHAKTGVTLSNLANVLRILGDNDRAESDFKKALLIIKEALGPDHLPMGYALSNYALLLQSKGQDNQAIELLHRALIISEATEGREHPSTAISATNLALAYHRMKIYKESKPLFERALLISKRKLGLDHPTTARILANYAILLRDMGETEQATALAARADAIWEKHRAANGLPPSPIPT